MEAGSSREADLRPAEDPTQTHPAAPTLADPAPLGLACFATTTFVLSIFNANLVNPAGTTVVLGLTLATGGIGQLIAGWWEFHNGNTFGATVFTSYGTFWISFFVLLKLTPAAGATPTAISVYLYAWTIFTIFILVASLKTAGAIVVTLLLLVITLLLLAISYAGGSSSLLHLGGYFGIATALAAWYTSAGGLLAAMYGREILPLKPLA
jgi:succinate-acetate transporter protein